MFPFFHALSVSSCTHLKIIQRVASRCAWLEYQKLQLWGPSHDWGSKAPWLFPHSYLKASDMQRNFKILIQGCLRNFLRLLSNMSSSTCQINCTLPSLFQMSLHGGKVTREIINCSPGASYSVLVTWMYTFDLVHVLNVSLYCSANADFMIVLIANSRSSNNIAWFSS
jgi:hypothetical protein